MAHNHLHRAHARQADVPTIVSVVYVTASKTFDGAIGGYSTVGIAIDKSASPKPKPEPTSSAVPKAKTVSEPVESSVKPSSRQTTLQTQTSALPTAITAPKTSIASSIALLAASGGVSSSSIASAPSSSATASSSSSESTSSGGMSTGGKIGMAVGILLLLGGVLSIILFCFKKRKTAAKEAEAQENEKFVQLNRTASVRTTATAPRLSLRPMTKFLPNLAEKRASRGNPLATHLAPVAEPQEKGAWDRSVTGQANNQENPFGNHAETIPAQNPFGNHANIDPVNASGPAIVQMPAEPMVLAAVAPVGLKRGASKRENNPAPIDFTTKAGPFMGPPSPAGTEFSMSSEGPGTPVQTSSGAAIAAAGGPVNSAVHRVQLDFNPSMEDELDLKQGQLIRVLHEYDDGWALCIRLDRSKQGVVPRTCLSTRPVKPRPMQNGPRGPAPPGMRGPPQQQHPMSPGMNGQRMAPNALQIRPSTPNGQHPRPASPAGSMQQRQSRPMVQGQDGGRARSNSAAPTQRPRNAPVPSQMNPMPQYDGASSPQGSIVERKPVPGQAL